MDYQEIVDQFVSNENELKGGIGMMPMTENQNRINSEGSLSSSNEIKVKAGLNISDNDSYINHNGNDINASSSAENLKNTRNSANSNDSISLLLNEEFVKIQIHMKSLIKARQQARQTVLLQNIKQRNQLYTEFRASKEQEAEANREKVKLASAWSSISEEGMIKIKNRNNERRRAILKENKNTNENQDDKNMNTNTNTNTNNNNSTSTEMDIDKSNDEENISTSNNKMSNFNELIPCRLELDYDGYRLSDVLLLSSSTRNTSQQKEIEAISTQMCQDYELPMEPFQAVIVRCLKDQLEEWDVYQGAMEGMKIPFDEIGAVPLRLDVIVGLHRFEDQLEVSLDPLQSTSEVMLEFVKALQSPDERVLSKTDFISFKPLILHNLLEQLMLWRRAIVFGGFHRDGRSNNLKFHDGDVAVLLNDVNSLSVQPSSVRRHFAHTNTFTPILSTLTIEELDKIEAGRERESRRRRRTTGVINSGPISGKRAINNTTTSMTTSTASSTGTIGLIVNNLSGTVRSPPRTLPTPTSYRGNLHRVRTLSQQQQSSIITKESDDDESIPGAPPRKRQQRGRKAKSRR